jgi:hypothetical protein
LGSSQHLPSTGTERKNSASTEQESGATGDR